jgi:hypothetical protein
VAARVKKAIINVKAPATTQTTINVISVSQAHA